MLGRATSNKSGKLDMETSEVDKQDRLDRFISRQAHWLSRVVFAAKIIIPILTIWLVWHELHRMHYSEIQIQLASVEPLPLV